MVSDLDLIISEINMHLAVGYYHRHVLNIWFIIVHIYEDDHWNKSSCIGW